MPDLVDLEIIMLSRVPIIVIETFEDPRALDLIKRAGMKLQKPVFSWSVTEGVQRIDLAHGVPEHLTTEPGAALAHIKQTGRAGVYILCDFHPFLCEAPKNVRLLKEIAMGHDEHHHTLILLSHALDIPPEIQRYGAWRGVLSSMMAPSPHPICRN